MATSRDIDFDPSSHVYRLVPSGLVLPSVTQILRETRVSTDFEALRRMGGERAEHIDAARAIGSAAHADAHAYDDGDLNWLTVHPDVLPYVEAWAVFREHKKLSPTVRERIVYHPTLGYTGTLDGIFTSPAYDAPILIDIATGDPRSSAKQFQTAAYLGAYAVEHPAAAACARWAVQLIPERRVPYEITPYVDWKDFEKWRAFVTTFYEQAERRAA